MTILQRVILVYAIGITLLCTLFATLYFIDYPNKHTLQTNYINLTNYVKKDVPKYIDVYNVIQDIQYVYITNTNKTIDTNILIRLTIAQYSDLVLVITKYSNYSQSLITAIISNDDLILTHYDTTNIIKLPNLYIEKLNSAGIGYTSKSRVYIDYNYKFLRTRQFDVKVGLFGLIPISPTLLFTNDYEVGLKISGDW